MTKQERLVHKFPQVMVAAGAVQGGILQAPRMKDWESVNHKIVKKDGQFIVLYYR